jgi:hypothetical protein
MTASVDSFQYARVSPSVSWSNSPKSDTSAAAGRRRPHRPAAPLARAHRQSARTARCRPPPRRFRARPWVDPPGRTGPGEVAARAAAGARHRQQAWPVAEGAGPDARPRLGKHEPGCASGARGRGGGGSGPGRNCGRTRGSGRAMALGGAAPSRLVVPEPLSSPEDAERDGTSPLCSVESAVLLPYCCHIPPRAPGGFPACMGDHARLRSHFRDRGCSISMRDCRPA